MATTIRIEQFKNFDEEAEDAVATSMSGVGGISVIYQDDSDLILISGTGFGVTDHGSLSGLGDDDHVQYALAGVSRSGTISVEATSVINQDVTTDASPSFATVKCSGLTDGYIPYHVSDAAGLADSALYVSTAATGKLLVNTSTAYDISLAGTSQYGTLQMWDNATTSPAGLSLALMLSSPNTNGPWVVFGKSRSAVIGTNTIVQGGDLAGAMFFRGADGTNYKNCAAIYAMIDGTPGAGDMPGRLMFLTTPDGSATVTERMRITSTGYVGIGTASPLRKLHLEDGFLRIKSTGATEYGVELMNDAGTAVYLGIGDSADASCAHDFYVETNAGKSLIIQGQISVLDC